MATVLVTGSTGTVGTEVVRGLLERSVDVRAAVVPAEFPLGKRKGGSSIGANAVSVAFDFLDPTTFPEALDGVDVVFLMRPPKMSKAREMRPFIAAMVASDVRQVVFMSVIGAGKNLFVPHHGIEETLHKSGLAVTVLRPSFFMQNLSTIHAPDIRERDEIFVPAGDGRTSMIDAADVAEAAAVVLTGPVRSGASFDLTGAEALTYHESAEILTRVCGRRISYGSPSGRAFSRRMKARGHDVGYVRVMRAIYLMAKLGRAARITHDLERLIGRPPTTFEQFARAHAVCFAPEVA